MPEVDAAQLEGEAMLSDRIADLVEYLVVQIVDDPDSVSLEVIDGDDASTIVESVTVNAVWGSSAAMPNLVILGKTDCIADCFAVPFVSRKSFSVSSVATSYRKASEIMTNTLLSLAMG